MGKGKRIDRVCVWVTVEGLGAWNWSMVWVRVSGSRESFILGVTCVLVVRKGVLVWRVLTDGNLKCFFLATT